MRTRTDLLRLAVRLTGPLLLLAIIWRLEDKGALWRTIESANGWLLAAAVLLNIPVVHFKVERWRSLLAARGHRYPLGRSYVAVLASACLGMLTPGHVGDVMRVQYARRDIDVPYAEGVASALVDRFCDLYILAAIVALGTVHLASALNATLAYASWAAVALAVLAPTLLLLKGPADWFSRALRRLTERWHTRVALLFESMRGMVRRATLVAIPLTVAAYAVSYFQGWVLARASNIALGYVDVASLLATTSLLALMPITVSGVGVRELFLALVFPALGLLRAQGVALGLLVLACNYLAIIVAGFIAWQVAPPPIGAAPVETGDPARKPAAVP
ncbi:MAG: flippase-like domain-containing protein [Polyangiaceae bacterium]|nr:flippase-like domain-containing protein [Polyangiaceae bacterium]